MEYIYAKAKVQLVLMVASGAAYVLFILATGNCG